MPVEVKICGVTTPEALNMAVRGGARAIGLVFYPPSPRSVTVDTAAQLASMLPADVLAVGLFVNANDADIHAVLSRIPLGMLQLHGEENPRRVAEIRARTGVRVMRAIRVADSSDLACLPEYEAVADWILLDAKVPKTFTNLPGGTGIAFDWQVLKGVRFSKPWMLAGGLTADNLTEAVATTGARMVDVSSGVEVSPGVKSLQKISAFLDVSKRL